MTYVFISYARPNEAAAFNVYEALKKINVDCFIDKESVKSDQDITDQIQAHIDECTHLVLILSKTTMSSPWVPYEIGLADGKQKDIICYYTSGVTRSDLPDYIQQHRTVASSEALLRYFKQRVSADG